MGNVSSPMIATGAADVILSLEPIEALRNIAVTNKETKVITDVNPIFSITISTNSEKYPKLDDIFNEIQSRAVLYKLDALTMAKKSGSSISKNIVMLGALSALDILPFNYNILLETILDNSPLSFKTINKKAFFSGIEAMNNLKEITNFY